MSSADHRRSWRRGRLPAVRWLAAPRLVIGVAGAGVLVLGAVKFGVTPGDAGAITLVIAGGALLVSLLVADRIQRVSVGASGVDLWLATQVSDRGAPEAAHILRRTELGGFAESYALVHGELRGDQYRAARIRLQDLLVSRASATATREKFEASEVRALFAGGSPVVRVLALGLMQGDLSLADARTITAAITDARSRNEQYQGLRLASLCYARLPQPARLEIRQAIEQAGLEPGSSRHRLVQEILTRPSP